MCRPTQRFRPGSSAPDPFELVATDIGGLSDGIKSLIGTDHPVLNAAAKYFFEIDGGKKIRPTMVRTVCHTPAHHSKCAAIQNLLVVSALQSVQSGNIGLAPG